mgnify:FL=1
MYPLLEVDSISKKFGSLIANDNISFSVSEGEILAVLGENGAGKTTLMNIIFGHYLPDHGSVKFNGCNISIGKPREAINLGIGMVHQHFTLAENLSVLENIAICNQSLLGISLDFGEIEKKLLEISNNFGLSVNPHAIVSGLSIGEKQRIEIIKTLFGGCKLVILDEPTASLTPQEVDQLFVIMKSMVEAGLGVIIISHKLDEILRISDRIIVLRNGKISGSMEKSEFNKSSLAEMIVGKKIIRPDKEKCVRAEKFIDLRGINISPRVGSALGLFNINFQLFGGEIHGIAGVSGNGQRAFAEFLSGHITPDSGDFYISGSLVEKFTPEEFMNKGIAYIPEDRNSDGVVGELSILENGILTEIGNPKIRNKLGFLNKKKAIEFVTNICENNDVRYQSLFQPVRLLSGGNIQKFLIGRWLERDPEIIIACQPTRGLDEGAIVAVQKLLLLERNKGRAVLFITEDLDELLDVSDVVSIMFDGKLTGPFPSDKLEKRDIGLMMTGGNVS